MIDSPCHIMLPKRTKPLQSAALQAGAATHSPHPACADEAASGRRRPGPLLRGDLSLRERVSVRGNSAGQVRAAANTTTVFGISNHAVVLSLLTLSFWFCGVSCSFAETILLTGATVHTASGPTLTPGQVLIRDGKIEAVEKSIKINADKVVQLDGQHLYPGLIAACTSLGLVEINA